MAVGVIPGSVLGQNRLAKKVEAANRRPTGEPTPSSSPRWPPNPA